MKYSEFHRKIVKNGWKFSHAEGSHYFNSKNGILSEPIPFHGSKEIGLKLQKAWESIDLKEYTWKN